MAGPITDVPGFIQAVVGALGGRQSPQTVRALTTWQRMEGGSTNNPDTYNFLNTKQPMPGSHGTLGSQGNAIQAYPDFQTGVQATVRTLQNGNYPALIQAIKTGNWAPSPELAKDLRTWSGNGYSSILGAAGGDGAVASAPAVQQAPRVAAPQTNSGVSALLSIAEGASPLSVLRTLASATPAATAPDIAPQIAVTAQSAPQVMKVGKLALASVPSALTTRSGIQVAKNILPSVAQVARTFGVKVNSGYRSPAHNAAVGGAPESDHLTGDAVDFTGSPAAMQALYKWAQGRFSYVEPWSQTGGSHVHISFLR